MYIYTLSHTDQNTVIEYFAHLLVANDIHSLRREVTHAYKDGKGALGILHVGLGLLAVLSLLQNIPQHEHIGLTIVVTRLEAGGIAVVSHPHLLGDANAILSDSSDCSCA